MTSCEDKEKSNSSSWQIATTKGDKSREAWRGRFSSQRGTAVKRDRRGRDQDLKRDLIGKGNQGIRACTEKKDSAISRRRSATVTHVG